MVIPFPIATGLIKKYISSISFSLIKEESNDAPPYTMMSLPFWLFILLTSSLRSPVAISVFIHLDLFSVLVNTTFGVSIIFLANAFQGSSGLFIISNQKEMKTSVIFRPRRMVSTDSVILLT